MSLLFLITPTTWHRSRSMQMMHLFHLFTPLIFSHYYFGLRVCCPNTYLCINDNIYDPIIVPNYDNWWEIYSSIEDFSTTSTLISVMNTGE